MPAGGEGLACATLRVMEAVSPTALDVRANGKVADPSASDPQIYCAHIAVKSLKALISVRWLMALSLIARSTSIASIAPDVEALIITATSISVV